MKTLIATMILSAVLPTLAFSAPKDRPAKISCKVLTPGESFPKNIVITKLNTESPEANISDASLVDPLDEKVIAETGVVHAFFSNECDNGYDVTFLNQNLVDLKNKKVESITGSVSGGNADNSDGASSLICTLK